MTLIKILRIPFSIAGGFILAGSITNSLVIGNMITNTTIGILLLVVSFGSIYYEYKY